MARKSTGDLTWHSTCNSSHSNKQQADRLFLDEMVAEFKKCAEKAWDVKGWYENPSSGIDHALSSPKEDAKEMNPQVLEYLATNPKTKGIISMDNTRRQDDQEAAGAQRSVVQSVDAKSDYAKAPVVDEVE